MSTSAQASPASAFETAGLARARVWNGRRRLEPPGERLCQALNELGGVYSLFGSFLSWRADLLHADSLLALAARPGPRWTLSRAEAIERLRSSLPAHAGQLEADLSEGPCWSSAFRCAFRSRFRGTGVAIQFARPPVAGEELASFERGIRRLREETLAPVSEPAVLAQFREWLRAGQSMERERTFLSAVAAYSPGTATQFPSLVPELTGPDVLGFGWVAGQPLFELIRAGNAEALQKFAEAILEQACLFAVIDGDLETGSFVLTPEGRVAVRPVARPINIPAIHLRSVLKYVSSVLAGNAPAASHALLRLTGDVRAGDDERMLDALSGLEPELKVNLEFPASVTQFESQWKALSSLRPERPLYLDCLHRNLVAIGYWRALHNRKPRGMDVLEQAFWPVLARVLRTRIGDLMTRSAASDWLLGSGLLLFESARQLNRMAEDLRDDDLSLRVQVAEQAPAGGDRTNRRVAAGITGGLLLTALLVSLRWGAEASGGASAALAGLALAAAAGLYWVVSRLD